MAQERLSVCKIREILRLKHEIGLSNRVIARACQVSNSTVGEYLTRARQAGLEWPLPEDASEEGLYRRFFPEGEKAKVAERPLPNWEEIHRDLARRQGLAEYSLPLFAQIAIQSVILGRKNSSDSKHEAPGIVMFHAVRETIQSGEIRKWTSNEVAHNLPAMEMPTILPAQYASIHCSRHTIRPARSVLVSHSSPAPGQPGTATPWARP